jgi:hypothetical protein
VAGARPGADADDHFVPGRILAQLLDHRVHRGAAAIDQALRADLDDVGIRQDRNGVAVVPVLQGVGRRKGLGGEPRRDVFGRGRGGPPRRWALSTISPHHWPVRTRACPPQLGGNYSRWPAAVRFPAKAKLGVPLHSM